YEATAFTRDMLHGRQPCRTVVCRWSAIHGDILGVHCHAQQGHVVFPAYDCAHFAHWRVKHRQSGAISITPHYSLSCGGHQLSMLAQQCAIGTEIEHSAIEGSEFALDNTDYNERIRLLGTMPDSLRFRARNSNRTREVASKIVPSFLGTNSHHDAKPIAF